MVSYPNKHIEFIISTMNQYNFSFVERMFKNILSDDYSILIINQCTQITLDDIDDYNAENVQVISVIDKGLSKSRNLALKYAKGDICVLTDDDVIFGANCIETIKNSFEDEVDVCTFQAYFDNGNPMKCYKPHSYRHNIKSIMQISSIECAFRLQFLRDQEFVYDNLFGLGAQFPACEENIFFKDLLDKKARIHYYPIKIVTHPYEETGGVLNTKGLYTRGAAFYRMFGVKGILIAAIFVIKKRKNIKKYQITVFNSLRLIWKGYKDYKTLINKNK